MITSLSRRLVMLSFAALLVSACNEDVEVNSSNNDPNNSADNNVSNNVSNNADNNAAPNNSNQNNTANNTTNNSTNNSNNSTQNNAANNTAGCMSDDPCEEGQICLEGDCAVGCRDNMGCTDGTICVDNACVQCRSDEDCSLGTVCVDQMCLEGCHDDQGCTAGSICEAETCVVGCRDDQGCDANTICEAETCVDGCRNDEACDADSICTDTLCAEGCRDDAGCATGTICEAETCEEGCRDDQGCTAEQLCLDMACLFRGVACRETDDCSNGDVCNTDTMRCEAGQTPCVADAQEPNDEAGDPIDPQSITNLTICPGDIDYFSFSIPLDHEITITLSSTYDLSNIFGNLYTGDASLAYLSPTPEGATLSWTSTESNVYDFRMRAMDPEARFGYAITITITAPDACVDTDLYTDLDEDGYGDTASLQTLCVEAGQTPEGLVSAPGDCGPNDAWRNPDAYEICGDNVDDNCDGDDMDCPATQPGVTVPDWDCTGDAPSNVYAWARFDQGNGYYENGGCFFFFEGLPGEFYVKKNLTTIVPDGENANCLDSRNGCLCPSTGGWPSYDRRLYAFTRQTQTDDCPEISIRDHGGEDQPVSNSCRKYLYQLHFYDIPYSFIAGDIDALEARLAAFPQIEVACAEDAPHRNLPFASLMTATIVHNTQFQAMNP